MQEFLILKNFVTCLPAKAGCWLKKAYCRGLVTKVEILGFGAPTGFFLKLLKRLKFSISVLEHIVASHFN